MTWDFSTEPEFQAKLDWMETFVSDEVEPLDPLPRQASTCLRADARRKIVRPLRQRCANRGCGHATSAPSSAVRVTGGQTGTHQRDPGPNDWGPIIFGSRHPTPATPRFWPCSAPTIRSERYLRRCSTVRSSPPFR